MFAFETEPRNVRGGWNETRPATSRAARCSSGAPLVGSADVLNRAFASCPILRGLVGTHFGTSRCGEPGFAPVPSTAGGGTARPCRLDGHLRTRRRKVPAKTRSRSRKAFQNRWYHRGERLVNRRRSTRRSDKVDEKSGALRLSATTHLVITSGKPLLELEPALRRLLTFTRSPRRRIGAFGTCAGKGWLHPLGGLLQLGQVVCAIRVVGGQRVVSVRSSGERGDEPGARSCDAAVCQLSWRLAAHPAAALIQAVRNRSARLEALSLPTQRVGHRSVECAPCHCDPVARASREDRMICTRRMNCLDKIDMCLVVPYE